MRDALGQGDLETVVSLGHRMRGAGGMFGFQTITDIGGAIEKAAGRGDIDQARILMEELSSYLEGADRGDSGTV